MEYFWWFYWATRLDGIKEFLGWMIGFSIIGIIISLIMSGILSEDRDEPNLKKLRPWRRGVITSFISLSLLYSLVPSKKDALFIAGGVGVIEGAKALQGSEVAKKSVAIVEQWLSNNLTELQQKGEKLQGKK